MKLIARTILITILALSLYVGYSSQDWQSIMVILIVSGFLLLLTFATTNSKQGATTYNTSTSYSDNNCSGSDSGCGGGGD